MGMSTHIQGIKPPDDEWRKMKAVYDACKVADIAIPEEVWMFFDWEEPNEDGVCIDLSSEISMRTVGAVRFNSEDSQNSWTINLSALPPGVTHVRFTNSY